MFAKTVRPWCFFFKKKEKKRNQISTFKSQAFESSPILMTYFLLQPTNGRSVVSPSSSFASSMQYGTEMSISRVNSIVEGAPVEGPIVNAGIVFDPYKCPISKREMLDPVIASDG